MVKAAQSNTSLLLQLGMQGGWMAWLIAARKEKRKITGERVTAVMAEYHMQLSEDAKDDADFQLNPDNTPLAELFVGMPGKKCSHKFVSFSRA